MSNKSGTAPQVISLPSGGGALKGIGETFSADLFTGTGNFAVPLDIPEGRNGFQPELSLTYSTGNGNGPFGLGWDLAVPDVSRKTAKGVPRYRDGGDGDTFVLSGGDDLVAVAASPADVTSFRPRIEDRFARIDRVRSGDTDHWEVRTRDGLVNHYGGRLPDSDDVAVVADPADRTKVFRWKLCETTDPFENRIEYDYLRDTGSQGRRAWDQLYLRRIRYVDHGRGDDVGFLVSVSLVYEQRPDPFSDHRPGFEVRTRLRCRRIEVRTHADEDRLSRTYELDYLDDLVRAGVRPAADLPRNGASLLARIRVVGHDGARTQELPPVDLGYSRFAPERQRFQPLDANRGGLPPVSLADGDIDTVDLFGNGLPDIVELNGSVRFWRNRGGGRFDPPADMDEVPAGVHLRDPGVQLADMNGDGRADLLVLDRRGYFPLGFTGRWRPEGFVRYPTAPNVDFADQDLRLLDLDGDGVIDALRTSQRFELFFNDPQTGWDRVETRPRRPREEFPDVRFSDPRVKLADLDGDGLQDIVLVDQGRVDYWPYLGHGSWAARVTMAASPVFPGGPAGFDPRRVLLGDVDGDGLDDLVYVEADRVTVWINQGGERWSEPLTVAGTPGLSDIDGVRVTDVLGTGMAGILWTADAGSGGASHYRFLDLTGGLKPYLLEAIDNHLGAVTRVRYTSSTEHYLSDDAEPETRWRTPLPFPVHVVDGVDTVDQVSGSTLSRRYRYHHGYWDGVEQELVGFGLVDQLDTETFDRLAAAGAERGPADVPALDERHLSPPTLTRTWFHQGPVGDEPDDQREQDHPAERWPGDPSALGHTAAINGFLATLPTRQARRDALRALAGRVLRTELYLHDGSAREDRPHTVTETAYQLREESAPGPADGQRRRVFFPHLAAERVSRWERGDEPLTTLSFEDDHDPFGQPRRHTRLAVPRGRDFRVATARSEPYLGTTTTTSYARPDDERRYLVDRVAATTTHEVVNDGRPSVFALHDAVRGNTARVSLVGQTLSYYDGPAFEGLPHGRVGWFGALVRSERLVLTEDIVRDAYRPDDAGSSGPPPYLAPDGPPTWTDEYPGAFRDALPTLAGYTFSTGAGHRARGWFVQEERHRYDVHDTPASGRGLLVARRDRMGRDTVVEHDRFGLLPVRVTNPAGLVTTADHDPRMLQPRLVADVNGNRTAFGFTPLGLLERISLMGRSGEAVGDTPEVPGTRFVYDFAAVPVSVRTVERVHHVNDGDVPRDQRDQTIEKVEVSDGFGRLVQTRTRAEDVLFGDPVHGGGTVPGDQADPASQQPVPGRRGRSDQPNVVVSGWQVYDNKGRVVEAYEPFYATGWTFQPPSEAQLGQRTTSSYDPLGQLVRTVRPDGAEELVVYGIPADLADPEKFEPTPWETFTYDANDNAGRSHGPAAAEYEHHWNTPTSVLLDALGRTVRTVARTRAPRPRAGAPLPAVQELRTRAVHDIRGNLRTVTDGASRRALRYVYDLDDRVLRCDSIDAGVRHMVVDADGREIERRDAKGALVLQAYDILGRPTRLWARDAPGDAVRLRELLAYGDGGRPDQPPAERAASRAANRLGALNRHHDDAGVLTLERYDIQGNVLDKSRRVVSDEAIVAVFPRPEDPEPDWRITPFRVDWQPPAGSTLPDLEGRLLEPRSFPTTSHYDALGRVTAMVFPEDVDGQRRELRAGHNEAGALQRVVLDDEVVVEHIAYDATGRRTLVALGNGVMTRYAYDRRSFQLLRQRAERYTKPSGDGLVYQPTGEPLQDVVHRYDAAGNVVESVDRTPGSGVSRNPAAAAVADSDLRTAVARGDALVRRFAYDPLHRLVSATGRECGSARPAEPWSDPPRCGFDGVQSGTVTRGNAAALTTTWRETYQYDNAGNLVRLRHDGAGSAFVRRYMPAPGSNRLARLGTGETDLTYGYDPVGNLVQEAGTRHFAWDHSDRMVVFRTQASPTSEPSVHVHYLYDAAGERTRKLVRKQGGAISSVTYVDGSFEHHRWSSGAAAAVGNDVVHVLDGEDRVAQVRIGPAHPDDRSPARQYHLRDHLASSNLVTDQASAFVNREEYLPFGETSFGSFGRKRFRFTGRERDDESGLAYHGARYYAPWLGRWTGPDPAGPDDDLNLYAYVGNAPSVFNDPDGTQRRPKEEITQEGQSVVHTRRIGNLKMSKCLDYDPRPKIVDYRPNAEPARVHAVTRGQAATIVERPDLQPSYKVTDPFQRENDRRYYNRKEAEIVAQRRAALAHEKELVESSLQRPAFSGEAGFQLAAAPLALLGFTIVYLRTRVQTGGLYVGRTGMDDARFIATATSRIRLHNRRGARQGSQFEWRALEIVPMELGPIVEQEYVYRFGGTKLDGGRLENISNPMVRRNYEAAAQRFGRPIMPVPGRPGTTGAPLRLPLARPPRARLRLPRRGR